MMPTVVKVSFLTVSMPFLSVFGSVTFSTGTTPIVVCVSVTCRPDVLQDLSVTVDVTGSELAQPVIDTAERAMPATATALPRARRFDSSRSR